MKQPEVPIKNTVVGLSLQGIPVEELEDVATAIKHIGDCVKGMPFSEGVPPHAFRGVTIAVSQQNPLEYTVFITEAYRPLGASSETRINSHYRTRGHLLLDAKNHPVAAFGMLEQPRRKSTYDVPHETEVVAYQS